MLLWITRFYNCYCFCIVVFCMCNKNSLVSTLQKGKNRQTRSSGNKGDSAGHHDRHYSWHIKNLGSFLCFKNVKAKERFLRSDLQKSSMVSRRVLMVSNFSPDMRHRTRESTMTVIWNAVKMSRRASIVARVSSLGSKWRQTIHIWCFRGLGDGKGWRERSCPLTADLCICKCWYQRQDLGQSCGVSLCTYPYSYTTEPWSEDTTERIKGFHLKKVWLQIALAGQW